MICFWLMGVRALSPGHSKVSLALLAFSLLLFFVPLRICWSVASIVLIFTSWTMLCICLLVFSVS